jgi:hypothetical protein
METTTICEFCGLTIDGHCEDCEIQCTHCDCWFPREEVRTGPDGKLCEDCFSDLCVYCDRCDRPVFVEDTQSTPNSDTYCDRCFEMHCTTCNDCGDTIWTDSSYSDPNDRDLCDYCYHELCFTCEGCGATCWSEESVACCDGNYCEDCAPDEDCHDGCSLDPDGRHNRMVSKRRFGVEIETHSCDGYSQLSGNIAFDIKEDCSIRGKEFASVILAGDLGLEAIEDLCKFGKEHDWTVNSNCGLHIHLDMSKEKTEALKAATIAYLMTNSFWLSYVSENRHYNHYCGESAFGIAQVRGITRFSNFSGRQSRYEWLNVAAYSKHKTFEVRVHQGSVDAKQICNWIRIHSIFMDWATSKTCDEVTAALKDVDRKAFMAQLCREAGCEDLVAYYYLTPAETVV